MENSEKLDRVRVFARYGNAVGLVALGGVLLRLLHIKVFHYSPIVDMITYLAQGELWTSRFVPKEMAYLMSLYPPGYPIFVGLVRMIFGQEHVRAILWIQGLLDGISIVLFAIAGRFLYGARAGLLAALVYALYRFAILGTAQIMTENLTELFCIASIAAFLWYSRRPSWARAVVTSILLGLAVQFRVTVLPLLGVFCLYAMVQVWQHRSFAKVSVLRLIKYPAIMAFTTLVVMSPTGIRNSVLFKRVVFFNNSNAVNFIEGNNPASKGENTQITQLPRSWQARLKVPESERETVASELADEYLFKTHTAYFLLTVLPNRFVHTLWDEHWNFTGQNEGAPMEIPFGPKVRIPLLRSRFIVMLGLVGLFLREKRCRGFSALTWVVLFLPALLLATNPRYRYVSEVPLVLSCAAVLNTLFFRKFFERRLSTVLVSIAVISIGWTAIAWASYSGPNLVAVPEVLKRNPILRKMVESTFVCEKLSGVRGGTATLEICRNVPVDAGHWPDLAFQFDIRLLQEKGREDEFRAWHEVWPLVQLKAFFFDDSQTTIASAVMPHTALGAYQNAGAHFWEIVDLPGQTCSMSLVLNVQRAGRIEISHLKITGPIWRGLPEPPAGPAEPIPAQVQKLPAVVEIGGGATTSSIVKETTSVVKTPRLSLR